MGFIVTNLETDSRAVVRFYNKRGTAEQWIKEGKQAVKMTRLREDLGSWGGADLPVADVSRRRLLAEEENFGSLAR